MANTLYEYYQQKGQALPSWQQRVPIAQQFGIQNYTGTAEQNAQLLAKLQAQGTPQATTSPVGTQTPQFPNLTPELPNMEIKAKIDALLGQVKEKQIELEKAKAYEVGLGKTGGEIPSAVIASTTTPTEAQREGRITKLEETAFAQPEKTYDEIYQQAYQQSGLANIQTSISAKDAEISKAKEALINEEGKITENPWLTETGRVGRIKTLYEMAEPQISRLVNERAILQSQFDTGKTSAENVATRTQAEELAGRTLKQQELDYLLKAKASQTPDKGTPQLKTDTSGELTWLYPDGTSVGTGVMEKESGTGGLTPAQINATVNSIAGAFDNEQTVKDFNTASSQYQLMESIGTGTSSPGDDIAYVYAFAKLMDPNSVVREGEYNTVQKYAQSFLTAKELEAIRLVKNSNFLSQGAKQALLTAAQSKMRVLETQYKNTSSEYQRQIDDVIAGKTRTITDYSKAFPEIGDNQDNQTNQTTEEQSGFWSKVGNYLWGDE